MLEDSVLPEATEVAGAGEQSQAAPEVEQTEGTSAEAKPEGEAKPEKTPEQREIDRMRRKIDRLVRQREELRARIPQEPLRQAPIVGDNEEPEGDSEYLKLTPAQLQRVVSEGAARLAPVMQEQRAVQERRQAVVQNLAKAWGQEKFDSLAKELNATFNGLADERGQMKPATEAIFEAEDPQALIEYLTNDDNADEAESLSRMSALKAGMAIGRLEAKMKSAPKPQASNAPKPLEAIRGQGGVSSKRLQDLDGEEFDRRRREQIKARGRW